MNIDKKEILQLFNIEDFKKLKEKVENKDFADKEALLNALNEVMITHNDLMCYNGLIQKYGEVEFPHKITQIKRKQLSILRKEIEKL